MSAARIEHDSMGDMTLPADALYGASTQRAVLNFPISGHRFPRAFIRALGLLKTGAAQANRDLGLLDPALSDIIVIAASEVAEGLHDRHFPLDIFQTGSGTSTNTNANEVIANRCSQLHGLAIGSHLPVHPNDHVNLGQSSNDVIPSSIHIAAAESLKNDLLPALDLLHHQLTGKTGEFWSVLKIGRTHLMDATPIRLGQEFSGYARQIELGKNRVAHAIRALEEIALGGTAVGTGLNTHPEFSNRVCRILFEKTGIPFREAANHFEAQSSRDALVEASGQLKTLAVSLTKIANDFRWLASGPRCGFAEIQLPALQPGSSIMPGKVNPVLPEALLQVCALVIGHDATITWAGASGNFELNVAMPVIAHSLLESVHLLSNATRLFAKNCVADLTANRERCESLIEQSLAMVTSLAPLIGYDRAAEIAKESQRTGKTIREICLEKAVLPVDKLREILDPATMTGHR